MTKKSAEALRQERLKYMSAGKKPVATTKAPVAASTSTKPKAPTAVKPVVAEFVTTPVVDPSTLKKTSQFDLSLYHSGTKNPHWLVVADGEPVAKIEYQDLPQEGFSQSMFEAESFGETLIRAFTQEDPAKILASTKARMYIAKLDKNDVVSKLKADVTANADEAIRLARADLRNNMLNVISLVVKAQTKNYLPANTLKADFYEVMKEMGVPARTASMIIEKAWEAGAPAYFEATLKQAEEWMDVTPDTYKHIEKTVNDIATRTVEVDAEDFPVGAVTASTKELDLSKFRL